MNIRWLNYILLGTLSVLTGWFNMPLSAAPAAEPAMRVHWLGLKQIGADTNAAKFMSVWRLPQTTNLLAQTLDKLSRRPGSGVTNTASALIRPLLDDLVSSETYLEVCAPTNFSRSAGGEGRGEVALNNSQLFIAVRLPADRAQLWQTNLAAVQARLTDSKRPIRIEYSRAGEWMLVGLGQGTDTKKLNLAELLPHVKPATNFWLEADFNVPRPAAASAANLSGFGQEMLDIKSLHLTISSEANDLLARATLDFSRPLKVTLPPWEIPTNFLRPSLTRFTAVRGLGPWLAALPAWQRLRLSPAPDQVFSWAQSGFPFQAYVAAPLPAASNQLSQLSARLVQKANPWLATNADGNLQWQTNPPGLFWKDTLMMSAFLKPAVASQRDYLLGGLIPLPEGDPGPLPAEILRPILDTTNLVYYDAELTGPLIEDDLFISQLLRLVFHKAQLQPTAAATLWLRSIEPILGGSATAAFKTGEARMVVTRKSTIGLTALELHLLADWLESPEFPKGLHTFLAPQEK